MVLTEARINRIALHLVDILDTHNSLGVPANPILALLDELCGGVSGSSIRIFSDINDVLELDEGLASIHYKNAETLRAYLTEQIS